MLYEVITPKMVAPVTTSVWIPLTVNSAIAISPTISIPFQKAEKFPAMMPESIVNEDPPSRDAFTISFTCLDLELVNALVNSGIRITSYNVCYTKLLRTNIFFGSISILSA